MVHYQENTVQTTRFEENNCVFQDYTSYPPNIRFLFLTKVVQNGFLRKGDSPFSRVASFYIQIVMSLAHSKTGAH